MDRYDAGTAADLQYPFALSNIQRFYQQYAVIRRRVNVIAFSYLKVWTVFRCITSVPDIFHIRAVDHQLTVVDQAFSALEQQDIVPFHF